MTAVKQKGVTLVVVLVTLVVLLLGSMALARLMESGTLIAGNVAQQQGAVKVSDIGTMQAFEDAIALITDEEAQIGQWYFPYRFWDDANGMPNGVDWPAAPTVSGGSGGQYTVRFIVERMCNPLAPGVSVPPPIETNCIVRQDGGVASAKANSPTFSLVTSVQFRATIHTAPRHGGVTLTQLLFNR